jgi:hypothetical protein
MAAGGAEMMKRHFIQRFFGFFVENQRNGRILAVGGGSGERF